ncbi:MAG: glycosyltransferase [Chloroflexi bacterium]|nr:glycosyltransferase [Chloroflexota bacterium]
MTGQPLVSVLLPIWCEREHIPAAVAAFRALRYASKELVLCAGGHDRSYEEALRFAATDVVVLEQKSGEGKQHALAKCLAASHGTVLFLTDADARLTDESFQATLSPILQGEVEAATGPRAPWPELRLLPIIAYQWAIEEAGNAQIPDDCTGLLGSNVALTREAAERAGGFGWEARTGTDLSLAYQLRRTGARIRYVRGHPMSVALATTARDYSRQRSRWLRNLVLHGRRFNDAQLERQGLIAMATGLGFWVLVLPGPAKRVRHLIWLILFGYGFKRRLDYIARAPREAKDVLTLDKWPLIAFYMLLDYFTWARAAIETANPRWRDRW